MSSMEAAMAVYAQVILIPLSQQVIERHSVEPRSGAMLCGIPCSGAIAVMNGKSKIRAGRSGKSRILPDWRPLSGQSCGCQAFPSRFVNAGGGTGRISADSL